MSTGPRQTGNTITEMSVNRRCSAWQRFHASSNTTVTGSLTMDAIELLITLCNTWVSLVMRAIRSPVRALLKKSCDRFCKWSNNRVRRSAIARTAAQFMR